jgi:hypothetical protein
VLVELGGCKGEVTEGSEGLKNPMWGEQKELQGEAAVAWRQLFGLDDCRFLVLELSEAEIIMFPVQCTIARDR